MISTSPLVTLSRRVFFSMGRRLWNPAWDETTNRQRFGLDALPHGNEYTFQVTFAGPVAREDGMIVNLADVKPIISEVVSFLDGRFLEMGAGFEADKQPTAENIALFLWHHLPEQVGAGTLLRIKLQESRRVSVELEASEKAPIMKVLRSYEFAAAHRLYSPKLSDQENMERYDKCSNYYGHGHNFGLDVVVQGEPQTETGFVIEPHFLDHIVDEEIFTRFDHKHLNLDCPEFQDLIPSSENLTKVIFDVLQTRLQREGFQLARVGLRETLKNYFEVEA